MLDSWEDDDYEPELLGEKTTTPTNWDDEEEEDDEVDLSKVGHAPQLSDATRKRMETRAAQEKQSKVDALLTENETTEDRRLRERRVVEESDNELTNELFGDVKAADDTDSVVIKLKDLKDHLTLVVTLNEKMSTSKRNHVVAFAKEFLRSNLDKFEATDLADFITMLANQREAKLKAQRKPTASKKEQSKSKKQSKKEQLEAQKRHDEKFGAASGGDKYDSYDDQFDDFF